MPLGVALSNSGLKSTRKIPSPLGHNYPDFNRVEYFFNGFLN